MPPKRKGRPSLRKKKVQVIRTRLIEISIKVEDLVYQKKPISEAEAQMYINEVNSYQVECSQDERSLQVIEKLMRCMKAVIAEHQEEKLRNDKMQYAGHQLCTGTSSPVYSLPDEDRTQMSQELEAQTTDLNRGEEKTNIEDCLKNYLNETEFHQDTEIYDLVSSDNENNKKSFKAPIDTSKNMRTINVEISKALSSLSLKDLDQDERMSIDIEFSQSILKNFNELNNLDHNSTSNVETKNRKRICDALQSIETKDTQMKSQDPVMELSTSVAVVTRSGSIIKSGIYENRRKVTEDINNNLNTTKQPIRTNLDNPYNYVQPSDNFNIISAHDSNVRIFTNALEEGTPIDIPPLFNKKIESKSINVIKPTDPFVEHNDITNSGSNVKTNLQENITNTSINSIITLKKKRKPRKRKVTENKENVSRVPKNFVNESNDTENKITKSSKRRTNSKKNNKTAEKESYLPIYNKNVENDLSWLEGIRFVREVGEDENDCKLSNLNEDFWDNYYLPPNFDDAEFV